MRAWLLASVLGAASPTIAGAEPQEGVDRKGTLELEVRVGSAERGWALIDRGSADGLVKGDAVLFLPREGGTYTGTVAELEERAARVELHDRAFLPAPGTRGKVLVPRERFGKRAPKRLRPPPKQPAAPAAEAPVFENQDLEWQEGDPLLAKVRPVRPDERAATLHGRSYAILDATRSTEGDRSDVFGRIGSGVVVENPFGAGGRLHADAEWNHRRVDVPDDDDEEDVELRLDRLSYGWGGTRFTPEGFELGRFLQQGMPEFGVLDGAEWLVRRDNGHRFGASLGFMPVPDEEFKTGSDFQVATHYRWVTDESERAGAALGYQKTFHNGAADRDLVVASFHRLPREGWNLFGTLWVDFYTDGDDEKGTLLGLTQAYLSLGRRWKDGSSLDLVYDHREFPEIDRHEFLTVEDDQLDDDHHERLSLTSAVPIAVDTRLRLGVGGWIDEDEAGGDAQAGFELRDFLAERGFLDLTAFVVKGRFETGVGARFSAGRFLANGRWALDYEFSQNRLDGFSSANDDLPQHRVRFTRDHAWARWDLSWRVEGLFYDDENAVTLGLYLQRSHY